MNTMMRNGSQNRIRNSRLIAVTTVLLTFCQSNQSTYDRFVSATKDEEIDVVLINAGDLKSNELARVVNQLSACSANVVGIHNEFLEYNSESDALLVSEIRKSGRVILSELQKSDGSIIRWAPVFEDAALAVGRVAFYGDEENVVTQFYPIGQGGPDEPLSFAGYLAYYFNPTADMFKRFSLMDPTDIQYTHTLEDFDVLDGASPIECRSVKGKIVIIGYLGPLNDNTVITPFDKVSNKITQTYSVVAMANEVLTVLKALR